MRYSPVILTGGAGSRLWPVSREFYPKPLLPMFGDKTLLQETVTRLNGLDGLGDPLLVCNEEHRFLVAEQLHQLGIRPDAIMLEPQGRNTAPALTVAALHLAATQSDVLMVVMPADHVIPERALFDKAVAAGSHLADGGYLVTFGIVARSPETGYGYIRRGNELNDGLYSVASFVEKPDLEKAQRYLASGDYYWNSGIFLMRADRWLEEMADHQPAILDACKKAIGASSRDSDFLRLSRQEFLACSSDSIDYAVMEKTDRAAVVPLDAGWSDVGAWSSIWEVSEQDQDGNVSKGDVLTHNVRNSLFMADNRCIAAVGLDGVIVVETADAILVAQKDNCQDVKAIVNKLKDSDREEYRFHRRVYRPWGDYEGIDQGRYYQVKRLTVKPGAKLSLQLHHKRAEHWVVVKGTALVTVGERIFSLRENESTYIPLETKHRLENPGTEPLEIIEVQSGSYLGEDDIERFEDVYNRVDQ